MQHYTGGVPCMPLSKYAYIRRGFIPLDTIKLTNTHQAGIYMQSLEKDWLLSSLMEYKKGVWIS